MASSSVPHPTVSEPLPADDLPAVPGSWHRRLVAVGEILVCSSLPTQTLISAILQLAGWAPEDAAGRLSLPFILTLSLADTVVLIALMVALTRAHGESATQL